MLRALEEIEALFDELFPIPRSITGEGYRKSLQILSRYIPFEIIQTPSRSRAFDWTVPDEWVIEDAYLLGPDGSKVINFTENNLSVVNYSTPVDGFFELDELQEHLHSIPDQPDWTPYVTSYYQPNWGFCLPHSLRSTLKAGKYRCVIKSSFKVGSVDCGFHYLRGGSTGKTVLISSYLCHPSMANNELSGPIVLAALYERLAQWPKRRFDYLFLINPETIGSICFLQSKGTELAASMQAGLVLTCLGGPSEKLSYKQSRMGHSSLDRMFNHMAKVCECEIRPFDPSDGSDERQYCAGAFNLPVGQVARTVYGQFPEYHTSADNKQLMKIGQLKATVDQLEAMLAVHEYCTPLKRTEPHCEIQLGKRGLYPNINSPLTWSKSTDLLLDHRQQLRAITHILSYADGNHDLIDIADLTGIGLSDLALISKKLFDMDILK